MASSNNLATIEPWMFRSTTNTNDSWFHDAFARETESPLTKALQHSLFNHSKPIQTNSIISTSFVSNQGDYCNTPASVSTVTASGSGSGSEPETSGSKRRRTNLGVSVGKTTKRKSRASKRSMTTFIQADPANFRQMVQQVTGVKMDGNVQMPVVKPEPMRQTYVNRLQGLLPTLDTSAYLLDHQTSRGSGSVGAAFLQPQAMSYIANEGGAGDFYSFSSFPTLESSI